LEKYRDFRPTKLVYNIEISLITKAVGIVVLMPKTHAPETGTENWYQKTGTSFLVPVFRTR